MYLVPKDRTEIAKTQVRQIREGGTMLYNNISNIRKSHTILAIPYIRIMEHEHLGAGIKDFDKMFLRNAYPAYYRNSYEDINKILLPPGKMTVTGVSLPYVTTYSIYSNPDIITTTDKVNIASILGTTDIAVSLLRHNIDPYRLYKLGKEAIKNYSRDINVNFLKNSSALGKYRRIIMEITTFIGESTEKDKCNTEYILENLYNMKEDTRTHIIHIIMEEIYRMSNLLCKNKIYLADAEIDNSLHVRSSLFKFEYPIAIKMKFSRKLNDEVE